MRKKFKDFSRKELDAWETTKPYAEFYKQFGKTYHVRLQLESILKGKSIPAVSPLVTAMFMAEMKHQLLTAGHDLGACQLPLTLAVAKGDESFVTIGGREQKLKAGDLFIADRKGIISSVLLIGKEREKITPGTAVVQLLLNAFLIFGILIYL